MRLFTRKINVALSVLYALGVAVSVYTLYQLPSEMVQETYAVDLTQLSKMQPVLNGLYFTVGLSLALGLLLIAALWLSRDRSSKKMVTSLAKEETNHAVEEKPNSAPSETTDLIIDSVIDKVEGQQEPAILFAEVLSQVCKQIEASQAAVYQTKHTDDYAYLELLASFAYHTPEGESITYRLGEGLAGQAAKDGNLVNISTVPDGYIQIISGLGKATPSYLIIIPMKQEETVWGVVEIASFKEFSPAQEQSLQTLFNNLTQKLANNDNVSLAEAQQ